MKLLLITGPTRSGKDHAAMTLIEANEIDVPVLVDKFSMPIKQAFAAVMSKYTDDYGNVETYEKIKEDHIPLLGTSYRQWQLNFSDWMKQQCGRDIFGRLLLKRLQNYSDEGLDSALVVISDCGYQTEVDYLIDNFPRDDITLLTLTRDGCNPTQDARETVIPYYGVKHHTLHNTGDTRFDGEILHLALSLTKGSRT